MKKILIILMVLVSGISFSQTTLTEAQVKTIWGTGQMPKGLNLTNTWYTVFNKIPNYVWNSGQLVNVDLNQKNITNINKVVTDTVDADIADITSRAVIGTGGFDYSSAILQINSTNKGIIVPRMTTVGRNNISVPARSLLVYNTDQDAFNYYKDTTLRWHRIAEIESPTFTGTVTATAANITSLTTNTLTVSAKAALSYSVAPTDSTSTAVYSGWVKQRLASLSSLFTDDGTRIYATNTTRRFQVGSSNTSLNADFAVVGQGNTSSSWNQKNNSQNGTFLFGILNDGSIGIGTNTPTYKLDLAGTMRINDGGVYSYFTGGLVGLGRNPSYKLSVKAAAASDYIAFFNTSDNAVAYLGASSGDGNLSIRTNVNAIVHQLYSAGDSYVVNSAYNFGVGTNSPTYKLHVVGTAKITSILNISAISAAAASALTPTEGDVVIVNTTNGTFLVEGLYSYSNGAWRK